MNFAIRELEEKDLENGFLETLGYLSVVGDMPNSKAIEVFKKIKSNPAIKIFVAVNEDGKIVGATTLIIEQKFIHEGSLVGHIQDVVTHKDVRGMGIGKLLMQKAIEVAKNASCYKVILDCSDKNVPFYEKFGFKKYEIGMRLDLK